MIAYFVFIIAVFHTPIATTHIPYSPSNFIEVATTHQKIQVEHSRTLVRALSLITNHYPLS